MQELHQEMIMIEESQKVNQQYLDDYIPADNGAAAAATPLKDKFKRIQDRFEGAKTPE
jgi:hypothetical protein